MGVVRQSTNLTRLSVGASRTPRTPRTPERHRSNTMAQFRQAPLPFVGQKRMFLTPFTQILQDNIEGDSEG